MSGRRWTAAEDAVLRAHYMRRGGPARCAKMLPGRTMHAVRLRGQKVCPPRRPRTRWTARELQILRLHWGASPRTLREKLPGRSWAAITNKVADLGLARVAEHEGLVSLAEAARHCGFSYPTMVEILRAEGVEIHRYHGGMLAERRCQGRGHARGRRHAVDLDEAREAVERHLARRARTETIAEAARRYGMSRPGMRYRLLLAGVLTPQDRPAHRRLDVAAVDRAMAQCEQRARCGAERGEERAA